MQLERFKRDRARQSVGGPQVLSAQYLSSLEGLKLRVKAHRDWAEELL